MIRHSLTWQRHFRRWHRRIALVASLQLLAWTVSGIYFAFVDIEGVRGVQHRLPVGTGTVNFAALNWLSSDASQAVLQFRRSGELVVGIKNEAGMRWHTQHGEPLASLSATDAIALGDSRTDLNPDTAEWVDIDVAGAEYRGRELPLWRVYRAADPALVAYIDVYSGEVVAIRSTPWRWWDFLWSLHIMDYNDRDHIGTWLLKLFSVLALLTAVAGLGLYGLMPKRRR